MSAQGIVIVGCGQAAASAALALRENGFDGRLVIVGEEPLPSYERPPLSKAALTHEVDPSPALTLDVARAKSLDIALRLGAKVAAIDRARHAVSTSANEAIPYDRLVLATGASARRLSLEGADRALSLRDFDHAREIRRRFRHARSLVVVGGGFIGLEVAASARTLGLQVAVIETAGRLLGRAVPEDFARRLAARHVAEGAELFLASAPSRILDDAVVLQDGRALAADLVIAGIGSAPRTELAAAAGLAIDNGVAVDGALRTSDPDIFAIGDCCSFPHPLFGGKRIRLEAWRSACDQGAFVARSLMGDARAYAEIPWFWSDQYDLTLQIAGLPSEGATTARRDLGNGAAMDFHLAADGRLVGVSALGPNETIARDMRIAERLISRRATPDPAQLTRPSTKLKALLQSAGDGEQGLVTGTADGAQSAT